MFTEEERVLAGKIVKNPEMMAFLKKVYCPERPKTRTEIESVIAMPDEVYGQQMKALVIAEKHFFDAHANLKRIALNQDTKKSPIAPV